VKGVDGQFEATVDELQILKGSAETPDGALLAVAKLLESREREGATFPSKGIYDWEEYVYQPLNSMGKIDFVDLPRHQYFLRKEYPTTWLKMATTTAFAIDSNYEEIEISAKEIVWHYVYASISPSEKEERLLWTGNPEFHF